MAGARGKRAGLGSAFSAPAAESPRGEGLDAILSPTRPAPTPKTATDEEWTQSSPKSEPGPSGGGRASATPRRTGGRARSGARKRNTPIYLTDAVQDALRSKAQETGLSYAELAVEAFRSVQQIDKLFLPVSVDTAGEDEIPAAPVSAADRFPTGTNLVNIRFTDEQRSWLDRQWVAKGASSRSMFVATVLTVFLCGDSANEQGSHS